MKDLVAVVLAAGEGKRMKSKHSKLTHKILGKTLIEWVYSAAISSEIDACIMVVGHKADEVKACMGDKVKYVTQEQQLGTGHAVMQAEAYLKKRNGHVIVMCGDMPLISSETISNAFEKHTRQNNTVTIITADFENPTGYGRIIKDQNSRVVKIVEHKDASEDERQIREINSGLYFFEIKLLLDSLEKINNNNSQGEFYLTDTIEILIGRGKKVDTYKIENNYEIIGINDRVQLSNAETIKRRTIIEEYMRSGVTVIAPDTVYIESGVQIGMDTTIYPGTVVEGNSIIGQECIIGPNTRLVNSKVEDGAEVQNSVVLDSTVGERSHIGPFAYLRPGSTIGKDVKIGDFVEVKNSIVGNKTKVSHLSYIGDCDVGTNVNVGCGTIVVNYDGKKKHRTLIGDNVFIGCNTNLISPVEVKKNAYIAAGSTITDDVPENALAIARERQVVKEDWVVKKGLQRNAENK